MLEIHASTRGQSGSRNEDAFVFGLSPVPFAAVADGAGRADGAARRACDLFKRLLIDTPLDRLGRTETWLGLIPLLDTALLGSGESTFLGCAILENRIQGCFAGDSRACLQTAEGEMIFLSDSSRKSRLGTGHAIGGELCAPFLPGDRLLLLTDGIWTPFDTPASLRTLLGRLSPTPRHRLPEALLDASARTGHTDDMTAVVVFG